MFIYIFYFICTVHVSSYQQKASSQSSVRILHSAVPKDCMNVIVLFLFSVMDHRLFDFQFAAHQSFSVLISGPADVDASVKVTGLADL